MFTMNLSINRNYLLQNNSIMYKEEMMSMFISVTIENVIGMDKNVISVRNV